jgi:hypothetical protein
MKEVIPKFLKVFMLTALLYSCVDNNYDLDDIDDSGGFSPALVLPLGTFETEIMDLIKESGIPEDVLEVRGDTIYIVYEGSMSLKPEGTLTDGVQPIPPGIKLTFEGGLQEIEIDAFRDLASSGSALYPANPQVILGIKNYIGAEIDIDVNEISSYSNSDERHATFGNDATSSYKIHVGGANVPNEYASQSAIFDKTNGRLDELFSIAPDLMSYDFSVDLNIPNDGKDHFIVGGKYVDMDYEVRIPLTFGARTKFVSDDTLDFDLSGDSFVSDLDELTLWIDYENSVRMTVGLDIVFLDENEVVITDVNQRSFELKTAEANQPAKGSNTFKFDKSEFEAAKKARYAILKTILKVDTGGEAVNIRPTDYINLKLSAYSKVNF